MIWYLWYRTDIFSFSGTRTNLHLCFNVRKKQSQNLLPTNRKDFQFQRHWCKPTKCAVNLCHNFTRLTGSFRSSSTYSSPVVIPRRRRCSISGNVPHRWYTPTSSSAYARTRTKAYSRTRTNLHLCFNVRKKQSQNLLPTNRKDFQFQRHWCKPTKCAVNLCHNFTRINGIVPFIIDLLISSCHSKKTTLLYFWQRPPQAVHANF